MYASLYIFYASVLTITSYDVTKPSVYLFPLTTAIDSMFNLDNINSKEQEATTKQSHNCFGNKEGNGETKITVSFRNKYHEKKLY